ncbi:hypothetical protein TNCV_4787921 [Trichonephila clavipes]|nr:hypothetical protein TNCV_4787921 [Trichonephila clavipes]
MGFLVEVVKVSKRQGILTQEILQLMNKSGSEFKNLSEDDYAADKTYETCILEGKSSSDESEEVKHGNIYNGQTVLDHALPSKSLEPVHLIVLAVVNSSFQ